jgi:hypothetical protein
MSFWDGNMGTQIESFQTHKADILCLCLAEDESSVYCAGKFPLDIFMSVIRDSCHALPPLSEGCNPDASTGTSVLIISLIQFRSDQFFVMPVLSLCYIIWFIFT